MSSPCKPALVASALPGASAFFNSTALRSFRFFRRRLKAWATVGAWALSLAGCSGGGGDTSTDAGAPAPAPPNPSFTATGLESFGLNPSAFTLQRASSSAMAEEVWRATNTDAAARKVLVEFPNLLDRDLVYVFANPTSSEVARPAGVPTVRGAPRIEGKGQSHEVVSPGPEPFEHIQVLAGSGETKAFRNEFSGLSMHTTLGWYTWAPDGRQIRLWVEKAGPETKPLSTDDARQFLQQIAAERGLYSLVTSLIGPVAGPKPDSPLLAHPDGGAPVDIVLADINAGTKNNLGGFFTAKNYYRQSFWAHSSESVAVYLDLKNTYSSQDNGIRTMLTVFTHELTHAAVFEYRVIQRGLSDFDHWVEEMLAMLVTGISSNRVEANYSDFNWGWWPAYVARGHHACRLDVDNLYGHKEGCSVYTTTSAFGSWAVRHLGLPWISALLGQKDPGRRGVGRAIESASNQLLNWESAFVAWSATMGGLHSEPARPYGFPELKETLSDGGMVFAPSTRAPYYLETRALPENATIAPNAMFIAENRRVSGHFSEWVEVPPGATLTVLVR